MTGEELKALQKLAKIELARRNFFDYCNIMAPDFYTPDREYLVDMCNQLQAFWESDETIMIINVPPRHGKSRTACLFVEWLFGQDPKTKIITGSYNEMLSTSFSKTVRNCMLQYKLTADIVVYNDIFPNSKIKRGDAAANFFSLEGGFNNYLATSPSGTATGLGATCLIIDDIIKNAEEAFNEATLDKHWEWFSQTLMSRLEEGGKILMIGTRWATGDLSGRALRYFKEIGAKMRHVTYKALQDDGTMLCPEVLSRESYDLKCKIMGLEVVKANYDQEPLDIQGRLYSEFKTYTTLPSSFQSIRNYTDTADRGEDYLCSITYGVYNKEAYVLDVIYTKDAMEVTEPLVAKTLHEHQVNIADIESNNGGRNFARTVESLLKTRHHSNHTKVNSFYQSKNKKARILSHSTWCQEHIYFPENWKDRWSKFHEDLMSYTKEGKNKHDDAEDALTGVAEKMGFGELVSFE